MHSEILLEIGAEKASRMKGNWNMMINMKFEVEAQILNFPLNTCHKN